jgi:4-hydroxybenzoate polyprenyltransferase
LWITIINSRLVFRGNQRMVKSITSVKPNLTSFLKYNLWFFIYSYLLLGFSIKNFEFSIIELILIVTAFVCNSLVGFLINDYFDFQHDSKVGKGNLRNLLGVKKLLILTFVLIVIGLYVVFIISFWLAIILIVQLILFFLYSVQGIRLKEKGFLGIITDAVYAHVVPGAFLSVLFWTKYHQIPQFSYLFFVFLTGIQDILLHQHRDFENDKLTKQETFVSRFKNSSKLLMIWIYWLGLIFLILFTYEVNISFQNTGLHRNYLVTCIFLTLILSVQIIDWRQILKIQYQKIFIIYFSFLLLFKFLDTKNYVLIVLLLHPYFISGVHQILNSLLKIVYRVFQYFVSKIFISFLPLIFNYLLFVFYFIFLARDIRKKPLKWNLSLLTFFQKTKLKLIKLLSCAVF